MDHVKAGIRNLSDLERDLKDLHSVDENYIILDFRNYPSAPCEQQGHVYLASPDE